MSRLCATASGIRELIFQLTDQPLLLISALDALAGDIADGPRLAKAKLLAIIERRSLYPRCRHRMSGRQAPPPDSLIGRSAAVGVYGSMLSREQRLGSLPRSISSFRTRAH